MIMKVKLIQALPTNDLQINLGLEDYASLITNMFRNVIGLYQDYDLTIVGDWASIARGSAFIQSRVVNTILGCSNIVGMFSEIDGLLKLPVNSKKTDVMGGSSDTRSIAENNPITSGEDFTITNPSSKGYSKVESNGTHTITDENVNQQLDILDFRYRSTTLYLLIEKTILAHTDEYSTIY